MFPRWSLKKLTIFYKNCLFRQLLPLGHCCGQVFDGGASISGIVNGVAASIQKENQPLFDHWLLIDSW